ncbi:MAG: LysE family translocator [Caulobacterales bacterium]|nr:LysE family translocator [Caulobacterales bacterium]
MPPLGIDPQVLPAFALAMALIELTPGPNLAWLALLAASRGRTAAMRAIAGITVGLSAWLLVTLLGLSRTPLFSEPGLEVLRWVGAAYMVWLAYEALKPRAGSASRPVHDRPFVRGLAANLLNPKAAIFYLALLPAFIKPWAGPVPVQILILGGIHIAISVAVHGAVVLGAAEAASRLPPRWAFALRLFLAAGLLATTLWLLSIPLSPGPAT